MGVAHVQDQGGRFLDGHGLRQLDDLDVHIGHALGAVHRHHADRRLSLGVGRHQALFVDGGDLFVVAGVADGLQGRVLRGEGQDGLGLLPKGQGRFFGADPDLRHRLHHQHRQKDRHGGVRGAGELQHGRPGGKALDGRLADAEDVRLGGEDRKAPVRSAGGLHGHFEGQGGALFEQQHPVDGFQLFLGQGFVQVVGDQVFHMVKRRPVLRCQEGQAPFVQLHPRHRPKDIDLELGHIGPLLRLHRGGNGDLALADGDQHAVFIHIGHLAVGGGIADLPFEPFLNDQRGLHLLALVHRHRFVRKGKLPGRETDGGNQQEDQQQTGENLVFHVSFSFIRQGAALAKANGLWYKDSNIQFMPIAVI